MAGEPPLEEQLGHLVWWSGGAGSLRRCARRSSQACRSPGPPIDWLFQDFKWCSVSRADDRVSQELVRDWYRPAEPQVQLVAAAVARLVTWPESLLEATGGSPFEGGDLPRIRASLHARAERGAKVWAGAYLVPGVPSQKKVDSILDLVEEVQRQAARILAPTLRATWANLVELKGMGSFLVGQVTADLAQSRCWPGGQALGSPPPVRCSGRRGSRKTHLRCLPSRTISTR